MDDLRTRLGAEIRRLREAAGLSQEELSDQLGYAAGRNYVSRIENGRDLASEEWVKAVDRELRADGLLIALRFEVWKADQLRRIEEKATVLGVDVTSVQAPPSAEGEEGSVDRRQLFQVSGFAVAAATASDLSRAIAQADPDPRTVIELASDLDRIASTYPTTPYAELLPQVTAGWLSTERLLDTRLSLRVRERLTLLAGQYSYYLGQLAFATGDDSSALPFLNLARQHGGEVGDQLLLSSVAVMESCVAHFNGDYITAADIAGAARPDAHPYVRPKLAACEARAAALAGRPDAARAALDDMQDHVWTGDRLPGPELIDEEGAHAYTAIVYANL
ncbi:helix-turn-helix transcriptional regulator, partial [Frankia sp. Cr1]|uniref:helix-turn-helix domain-containing protein n=1 Tax=Frankia sp. Cr1 TaxID=3073931 RepID=UPI002AD283D3